MKANEAVIKRLKLFAVAENLCITQIVKDSRKLKATKSKRLTPLTLNWVFAFGIGFHLLLLAY